MNSLKDEKHNVSVGKPGGGGIMYDFVITILYLSEKMRNIKGAIYADIRLDIFWHVHVNGKIKLVISFECY